MIQVVTYSGKDKRYNGNGVEQYSLHDIRSLDEYDINVIDLGDAGLWQYQEDSRQSIDKIEDLKSISTMLANCVSSKNVIVLPQNEMFRYVYYSSSFHKQVELKNMLGHLSTTILNKLYPAISKMELVYENTKTTVGQYELSASFCFNNSTTVLLESIKSKKTTAILHGNVILTTLSLIGYDELFSFLREVKLLVDVEDAPEWMTDIKMFDDVSQEKIISDCDAKIQEAKQQIDNANLILEANNKLKAALYTNGDELVGIVFKVLEEMLGCDLSNFVDVKKEDVSFLIDGYTFIGEIKGVNHNVKRQNISQLDNHYQEYLDEHEGLDEKDIKALLIINHQKSKPISDREPIMDAQIEMAKRNGSLIIETYTLLKLLEKYRAEEISREDIIDLLKDNVGVLKI